jgi:hypothetical protein
LPIALYSVFEKAFMVWLVLSNARQPDVGGGVRCRHRLLEGVAGVRAALASPELAFLEATSP